jgi:hypothetical protein
MNIREKGVPGDPDPFMRLPRLDFCQEQDRPAWRRIRMQKPPNFIRNNEEWIIWLLAGEFSGSATPRVLSERTALPLDNIHDNFLYMERVGLLSIERDPGKKYPEEIAKVSLTGISRNLYEEMKQRPDPGDLF